MPKAKSKDVVLKAVMKSLRNTLPCPVKKIQFFGGVVDKPWPRKDVDVYVDVPHSECWSNIIEYEELDDLIYNLNEKASQASRKPVDTWLHFRSLGELYHEDGMMGVTEMWGWEPHVAQNVVESQKTSFGLNAKRQK